MVAVQRQQHLRYVSSGNEAGLTGCHRAPRPFWRGLGKFVKYGFLSPMKMERATGRHAGAEDTPASMRSTCRLQQHTRVNVPWPATAAPYT